MRKVFHIAGFSLLTACGGSSMSKDVHQQDLMKKSSFSADAMQNVGVCASSKALRGGAAEAARTKGFDQSFSADFTVALQATGFVVARAPKCDVSVVADIEVRSFESHAGFGDGVVIKSVISVYYADSLVDSLVFECDGYHCGDRDEASSRLARKIVQEMVGSASVARTFRVAHEAKASATQSEREASARCVRGSPLSLTAPAQPSAEDQTKAKHFYEQGQAFFSEALYEDAANQFVSSYNLSGAPELIFNIAQSQRLLKRCDVAIQLYQKYVDLSPDGDLADEARKDIAELTVRLRKNVD